MIGGMTLCGGQGGQAWQLRTHNVVDAGLLCAGLVPEQALALVGRVFSLCRVAHMAASIQALNLPAHPTSPPRMRDEILQDHALALLVTLPAQLGMPPQRESLAKVLHDRARSRDVVMELTGSATPIAQMDYAAFEAWLATGRAAGGAFLPRLLGRCQQALVGVGGVVAAPALTPAGVQAWLEHDPAQRSPRMDFDAGIWPDYAHYPLMRALVAAGGVTPFARLMARVLEFVACLEDRTEAIFARVEPFAAGLGKGVGVARAARGMLVHAAQVRGGVVTDYKILSPTFWHVAEGGLFRQVISHLHSGCSKVSVDCLLAALNPCVPVTVEEALHA